MTAFVIFAAGPGRRMGMAGDHLHKALLPLGGQAILSRQIAAAPAGARIIICAGYRAGQLRAYVNLAHPDRRIVFVDVPHWEHGGPGSSLLAARDVVGNDDMIITPCDTLWPPDPGMWHAEQSWAGVAPIPAGSEPERWCRLDVVDHDGTVQRVIDKKPSHGPVGFAYTGLAMIRADDLAAFWHGLECHQEPGPEIRDTAGLKPLAAARRLTARRITWIDTGDEGAYTRAIRAESAYDWSKPGEATWIIPGRRVIKYSADPLAAERRIGRSYSIAMATPPICEESRLTVPLADRAVAELALAAGMSAWHYAPGQGAYEVAQHDLGLIPRLLGWANDMLWESVPADPAEQHAACLRFYRRKTMHRIALLPTSLAAAATAAVERIDWDKLAEGCQPVTFHGDFNLGNIIIGPDGDFTTIDWRPDFAGITRWGDLRYDLGKLAAGMIIHWDRARRGDFTEWPLGQFHLEQIRDWTGLAAAPDVMTIAGLSLINCAPLHKPPLPEIAVKRGVALLETG